MGSSPLGPNNSNVAKVSSSSSAPVGAANLSGLARVQQNSAASLTHGRSPSFNLYAAIGDFLVS